ncbi:DnaJ C-terminal domain-containing protein [Leifsonia sp. NPDC014704]|uniref:DnaJ C-terminal domain-containing protein n=1 Tax=Leifsonia sp. NPDC014704 TaxID=3364123 RepID=UPI0036F4787E
MAEDLYQVLGVPRSADQKEIRRAYREKARKFHPDINKDPSAEEKFKRISEANDVLSDPETRAQYDRFGENFRQYAGAPSPSGAGHTDANGRPRRSGWASSPGAGTRNMNWDDLFGDVFVGDMFGGRRASRGVDHTAVLELTLEEAYRGGPRIIRLEDPAGGTREYEINIPAGALDGQRIRIPGAGGPGDSGTSGDLIVTLRVKPDRRYELIGADIEMELPILPWEAALGADVHTQTPAGPITVHVPPGSSSGRRLRLRGQGMPRRTGQPGDLYARLKIVVPKQLNEQQRKLFEQLRDVSRTESRRAS